MARNKTSQIALAGVMGALCLTTMFLGGILPLATFIAPALAGFFIVLVAVETGIGTGFLLYIAVAAVSILVVPEKEMSMIFVFFLGYYPLIKAYVDKLHPHFLQIGAKLAIFNLCIISMYALLLYVFPVASLQAEFGTYTSWMIPVMLLLGNFTFFVYDQAVAKCLQVYLTRFRPRILKGRK